jgi:bacterioferritin
MVKDATGSVALLNQAISENLHATMRHAIVARLWAAAGWVAIATHVERGLADELTTAQRLIDRLVFLGAHPVVEPRPLALLRSAEEALSDDLALQEAAVAGIRLAINATLASGDAGTRRLFEAMLVDEEAHLDWLRYAAQQLGTLGPAQFLILQTLGADQEAA